MIQSRDPKADSEPLKQADYPKVRFWFKRDWSKFQKGSKAAKDASVDNSSDSKMVGRGKARSAEGINVMMLYIERDDGTSVDGDVANNIRQTARSIWENLGNAGIAPTTWGQADMQVKKDYWREMAEVFPYLKLCDRNWKANQIATEFYTKWYQGWLRNKNRHLGNNQQIGLGGNQNKRVRKDSVTTMQKRLRPDALVSSIQSHLSHKLHVTLPSLDCPWFIRRHLT